MSVSLGLVIHSRYQRCPQPELPMIVQMLETLSILPSEKSLSKTEWRANALHIQSHIQLPDRKYNM